VTFKGLLKSNQAGSCNFETLLCARVGFNFWHLITYYSYSLLAFRTDGHFLSHVGNDQKRKSSFSGGEGRKKQAIYKINLLLLFNTALLKTKREAMLPFLINMLF
jgi:hypothetical protein